MFRSNDEVVVQQGHRRPMLTRPEANSGGGAPWGQSAAEKPRAAAAPAEVAVAAPVVAPPVPARAVENLVPAADPVRADPPKKAGAGAGRPGAAASSSSSAGKGKGKGMAAGPSFGGGARTGVSARPSAGPSSSRAPASSSSASSAAPGQGPYTAKPSARLDKAKAIDPFAVRVKHKTAFGQTYSAGGIPCRLQHGSVKSSITWDVPFSQIQYNPLAIVCAEGMLGNNNNNK